MRLRRNGDSLLAAELGRSVDQMGTAPMIRTLYLAFAFSLWIAACARQAPVVTSTQVEHPALLLHHEGTPPAAGTRLLIQFNNEPVIIWVADGLGGPPILYHGKTLDSDSVKSIRVLRAQEIRERFGDQKIGGAIVIELK